MAIGVLNKGLPNIGFPNINDISDLLNDQVLSPMELAQNAKYEAESYEIVTQDGYILQLDRITSSSITPLSANRTPVLLLHGILDCSVTWIAAGPGALGYTLADQGYDVWLGNVRGNRYSRKHLNLTTLDPDFWMFSWHEMGIYDLPAVIDHITEQTGQEKIFMVTYSQGGIAFFVMASERSEYQEKVIGLSALAPAVFMSRAGLTLFQVLSLAAADGNWILNLLGIHQFMPSGILLQSVGRVICPQQSPLLPACEGIFDLLFGYDGNFNNQTQIIVY
ncbi:Lipase 3 [Melipona quadrifasciata]|uniref:Lipase 3 n=1 Tax=Melipona quadrifasciata TaxID=166423 RepID=A0A0M8ZX75_9HYME|nr:Lipase 3 [Melipona quadrifasciata]